MKATMKNTELARLTTLADDVRRAERQRVAARMKRDAMILRVRERGVTVPAIAEATGLTIQRVEQIIYGSDG